MIPSSWNGTNIRRLMSRHTASSSSPMSSRSRNSSARLAGSSASSLPAISHSHATMTLVYALLRRPPCGASGYLSWNSSGPITPWIS
jgi:hypothetical protein